MAALGAVQVVNYILPLLVVPYLISVLGGEAWSKIAYAQVILQYLIVIVSYGFQWSAVQYISVNRFDMDKVSKSFSSTWSVQWLLLAVSFFVLCAILLLPSFEDIKSLLVVGFLAVVGYVMCPIWLMQGLEELRILSLFQIISQSLCLLLIFVLVENGRDAVLAMLIQSINNIIAGFLCLAFVTYKLRIKFQMPTILEIRTSLKSGWVFFKSQIFISLYTNTIPFVLGSATDSMSVAIYAIADRIQKAFRFLLNPVSQALFPRIGFLYLKDKKSADILVIKSLWLIFLVTGIGGFFIFFMSDFLVNIFTDGQMVQANSVLKIFSIQPLLIGISGAIATQVMIPRNMGIVLNRIWLGAAIIAILFSFPVCVLFGVYGAALFVVLIEVLILLAMGISLRIRRIS